MEEKGTGGGGEPGGVDKQHREGFIDNDGSYLAGGGGGSGAATVEEWMVGTARAGGTACSTQVPDFALWAESEEVVYL